LIFTRGRRKKRRPLFFEQWDPGKSLLSRIYARTDDCLDLGLSLDFTALFGTVAVFVDTFATVLPWVRKALVRNLRLSKRAFV
jgi:hypothetical protein